MNTIPLSTLTVSDLHAAIKDVVRAKGESRSLSDLLARVDWSDSAGSPLRELVGALEGWSADYAEGIMPRADYLARLTEVLPLQERAAS
ncbi:MAG: hypothetical protein IT299_02620 [Dehalococcoidia bacterium]|nr:hypothetical protein [Dehalococcoidia bacterium]